MDEDQNFETYLFISPKKFTISVHQKFNNKIIYDNILIVDDYSNQLNLSLLDNFLEKNVFKIEKILGSFLKNIFLIIDYNIFFQIQISLKKNYYGDQVTSNSLKYLLNESKEQCKNTFNGKKIIHMIIDNYQIDKKDYNNLPKNFNCNYLSIDVSFLCLSKNFISSLEKVFKKYHILLSQIISANYMNNLIQSDDQDPIQKAKLIKNGFNKNEILLIEKIQKNKGFFEKFFNFFS